MVFEGRARSRAECTYNSAVTTSQKIIALGSHPQIGMLNGSYYSCPIWLSRAGSKKPQAKQAVRKILETYDAGSEPGRAVDAFAAGAGIDAHYMNYLKGAFAANGTSSGVKGLVGQQLQMLKAGLVPKVIDLTAGKLPFRTGGICGQSARGVGMVPVGGSGQ